MSDNELIDDYEDGSQQKKAKVSFQYFLLLKYYAILYVYHGVKII